VLRRKPQPDGAPPHDVTGVPGGVLFQMVAIQRKDSGMWAIPGGMVDDGELVSETLRREFTEEAGALEDEDARADLEDALDDVFKDGGRQIYRGYVDDPRNTDNAWMETTVFLFYIDDSLASRLTLSGGSDALHARWLDVDGELLKPGSDTLYADHKDFVLRALEEREYLRIPKEGEPRP
jgi:ADP-ribose pyrophosphatase